MFFICLSGGSGLETKKTVRCHDAGYRRHVLFFIVRSRLSIHLMIASARVLRARTSRHGYSRALRRVQVARQTKALADAV